MPLLNALTLITALMVSPVAQADPVRDIPLADLSGTTWSIPVPGQFPATLQFTDAGFSVIAACNGLDVSLDRTASVTDVTQLYTCGTPPDGEAAMIKTLTLLSGIVGQGPRKLILRAEDGSTVEATR